MVVEIGKSNRKNNLFCVVKVNTPEGKRVAITATHWSNKDNIHRKGFTFKEAIKKAKKYSRLTNTPLYEGTDF